MYEERSKFQDSTDYFNPKTAYVEDFSDENIQKIKNQNQTINKGILKRTKEILTEEQYNSFKIFMVKRESRQKIDLKIIKQRFMVEK